MDDAFPCKFHMADCKIVLDVLKCMLELNLNDNGLPRYNHAVLGAFAGWPVGQLLYTCSRMLQNFTHHLHDTIHGICAVFGRSDKGCAELENHAGAKLSHAIRNAPPS